MMIFIMVDFNLYKKIKKVELIIRTKINFNDSRTF